MKTRFLWVAIAVGLSVSGGLARLQAEPATDSMASPTPAPMEAPATAESPAPSKRPIPPPVVPCEKLIGFLPATPEGWTSEKPSGSTNEIEVFNLSMATQTYQKGDADNASVVTVTLIDAGGHKGYFEAATALWKMNAETPEGYDRTVEIDGMPGYEHFKKGANSGSLSVVAGGRYFIQIEVTNLDPGELRKWLKKIDVAKLSELN